MTDNTPTGIEIPHNFYLRHYQKPLWSALDSGIKRAVCVWHRRAGKDLTALNRTVLETVRRPGIYYHCLPKTNQGRKVIWDGMDGQAHPFLDFWPAPYVRNLNNTEMKLETHNGSLWQVIGSDNFDNVMGTNPSGIVFSEFSLQDPRAWDYFRPILVENKGWALFLFTPRGRNHAFDIYRQACGNPLWFAQTLTVDDTHVITRHAIEAERQAGMSDEMIRQEFYCDFECALPGAFYINELRLAREQDRITSVPFTGGCLVDTWWDLGMDDSTTIWFSQDVGREVHFIDYYENCNQGLEHYFGVLDQKIKGWGGRYGRHVAPHDIKDRELGTGTSRWETAKRLGITFDVVARPNRKEEGINACRQIFAICYWDKTKCQQGLDALASYRSEYVEVNRVMKKNPVHDWASHGADGYQTFALGHKFKQLTSVQDRWAVKPKKKGTWMSA